MYIIFNPQGFGDSVQYRTTDPIHDRGVTDDNLSSTDAPAHTQNGFKNLLFFCFK
jgi:hypothetical protein